jgi:ribonuclease D
MTLRPRILTTSDLPEAIDVLRAAPRVAVDTEFHAERRYMPKLFLVQLYVPGQPAWIVDPLHPRLLDDLGPALLAVPAWIVHAGSQDLRLLKERLGGLPRRALDTQVAAGLSGDRYPASLVDLLRQQLGAEVAKAATLSDWSQRPLSPEQLEYAADDVLRLPDLWDSLAARAEGLGRTRLVELACDEALAEAQDPPQDDTLWLKSPLAEAITAADAPIFRDLVAWREAVARDQDKPPHYLISDAVLRQLAHGRPKSRHDLELQRRLPKAVQGQWARPLLDIIADATAADPSSCPRHVQRDTPEARTVAWLEMLAITFATTSGCSPRLVLPEPVRARLALERPTTREAVAGVLGPWRDELIGDLIHRALKGDVAIRLERHDVAMCPSAASRVVGKAEAAVIDRRVDL